MKRLLTSQKIPQSWQRAIVRLFRKKGCTDDPANFRPISLSNCDGKIFFALLGKVIQNHMTKKLLFRLSYPKGFPTRRSRMVGTLNTPGRSHPRCTIASNINMYLLARPLERLRQCTTLPQSHFRNPTLPTPRACSFVSSQLLRSFAGHH